MAFSYDPLKIALLRAKRSLPCSPEEIDILSYKEVKRKKKKKDLKDSSLSPDIILDFFCTLQCFLIIVINYNNNNRITNQTLGEQMP